ncbi:MULTISPECIES: hypothetical protein [Kitasatospora]|uniref:Uncharacterized protein n=1 Tax=Kitasatospora cathayae TaxID=3004092 RepID=A0ABY7Q7V4_9ACTN|nr:hypothetical protein [Kitasatospora sp. HUAS 3-15]WBP88744.1 hypothetical protein O1G21_24845 [Kitasatospora sp. HUAS 3-15]
MGILDRLFHRWPQHGSTGEDAARRAALAHDEAADAYSNDIERTREAQEKLAQEEADRRAAENMTAEGDPWD